MTGKKFSGIAVQQRYQLQGGSQLQELRLEEGARAQARSHHATNVLQTSALTCGILSGIYCRYDRRNDRQDQISQPGSPRLLMSAANTADTLTKELL